MNIEDLVKYITSEILKNFNKKVLVFLSAGEIALEDIFNTLNSYDLLNYSFVITDGGKEVIPKKFMDNFKGEEICKRNILIKKIKEADLILIPILNRNILAKVSLGISDDLITLGIQHSLMMSKNILALEDEFNPQHPMNISFGYNKNKAYNKLILGYKSTLEDMGIIFTDSINFNKYMDKLLYKKYLMKYKDDTVTENIENTHVVENSYREDNYKVFKDKILTLEDLGKYLQGKNIYLKKDVIITPLASEFMYNKKISVIYKD